MLIKDARTREVIGFERLYYKPGTSTVENVTISILNSNGDTQATLADPIPAGSIVHLSDNTPSAVVYCRMSGIFKSRARVTLCLRDANEQCTVAVTAP